MSSFFFREISSNSRKSRQSHHIRIPFDINSRSFCWLLHSFSMVIKFYYTTCFFQSSYRGQVSFKTPLLATNPLPNPLLSQTVDIGYFKLILILRAIDWKYFSLILKQSSMFIRNTLYFASHFIKCFFCKIQ